MPLARVEAELAMDEAWSATEEVRELMTVWTADAVGGATMIGVRVAKPVGTEAPDGMLRDVVKPLSVRGTTAAGSTFEGWERM